MTSPLAVHSLFEWSSFLTSNPFVDESEKSRYHPDIPFRRRRWGFLIFCRPKSPFFPIIKVRPKFLIKGISSSLIQRILSTSSLLSPSFQGGPTIFCTLLSIPFSWLNALMAIPRACKHACTLLKGKEKRVQ